MELAGSCNHITAQRAPQAVQDWIGPWEKLQRWNPCFLFRLLVAFMWFMRDEGKGGLHTSYPLPKTSLILPCALFYCWLLLFGCLCWIFFLFPTLVQCPTVSPLTSTIIFYLNLVFDSALPVCFLALTLSNHMNSFFFDSFSSHLKINPSHSSVRAFMIWPLSHWLTPATLSLTSSAPTMLASLLILKEPRMLLPQALCTSWFFSLGHSFPQHLTSCLSHFSLDQTLLLTGASPDHPISFYHSSLTWLLHSMYHYLL